MRSFWVIMRRELGAFFLSPVSYVSIVVFLAAAGFTFLVGVLRNEGSATSLYSVLVAGVSFWLTGLITVLSMRSFAEEKRNGTFETLVTAPVTATQIVLGKYFGALMFLGFAVAPLLGSVFILQALSPNPQVQDYGSLFGGVVALALVSLLGLGIGLFFSLLTNSQVMAGTCTFIAIWGVLLIGDGLSSLSRFPADLSRYLSILGHMEELSLGVLDLQPAVLCLSCTVFVLFLAIRVLDSYRWR